MNNNSKKKIGKYMISMDQKLGEGAFAKVYHGVNEETKEEVAIKILDKSKLTEGSYAKDTFKSEIQINKKLKSANIIKFYDVHQTLNNFYIILELASGGTLR